MWDTATVYGMGGHPLGQRNYPFVPAPILEKVAVKVKNEIIQDEELGRHADDIIRNNALKLFNI